MRNGQSSLLKPEGPPDPADEARPLAYKLVWFAILAAAGLMVVASSAYVLRGLLFL